MLRRSKGLPELRSLDSYPTFRSSTMKVAALAGLLAQRIRGTCVPRGLLPQIKFQQGPMIASSAWACHDRQCR